MTIHITPIGMNAPYPYLALIPLSFLLSCDAITKRAAQASVKDFVANALALQTQAPASLFEKLRTNLKCTDAPTTSKSAPRAECSRMGGRVISVLSLRTEGNEAQDAGFVLTSHGHKVDTTAIVQELLGAPIGQTAAGWPAWRVPSGALSAHGDTLRIERAPSGDIQDVAELTRELHLSTVDEAVKRILSAVDKRHGIRGASTPEVSRRMSEGGVSPIACVGNFAHDGREVCLGVSGATEKQVLSRVHVACVVPKGASFDTELGANLLAEVVDTSLKPIILDIINAQRDSDFAARRYGNLAIVVTQQRFPDDSFAYQHMFISPRIFFTHAVEATIRSAANTPPDERYDIQTLVMEAEAEMKARKKAPPN